MCIQEPGVMHHYIEYEAADTFSPVFFYSQSASRDIAVRVLPGTRGRVNRLRRVSLTRGCVWSLIGDHFQGLSYSLAIFLISLHPLWCLDVSLEYRARRLTTRALVSDCVNAICCYVYLSHCPHDGELFHGGTTRVWPG